MLRPFLGHGPETLAAVLPQTWSLGNLSPNFSEESRFHTNFWDVLYAQGFFGLGAFLVFVSSMFFTVFARLGLVHDRRDGLLFTAWVVLCTLAGGALLSVLSGFGFAGLGAQIGLIAGLITFPLWRKEPLGRSILGRDGLRAIILISALVAYLVDIAFSFASAVTFCLFWILAGAATASEGAADTVPKKKCAICYGLLRRFVRPDTGGARPRFCGFAFAGTRFRVRGAGTAPLPMPNRTGCFSSWWFYRLGLEPRFYCVNPARAAGKERSLPSSSQR